MANERGRTERVLDVIDSVRGLAFVVVAVVIAVAAFRTGGPAGWAFGVGVLVLCGVALAVDLRRRT